MATDRVIADQYLEQAFIFSAILKSSALIELDKLDDDDFYFENNRILFNAIRDLYKGGEIVDVMNVRSRLISQGQLEKIGGQAVLAELYQRPSLLDVVQGVKDLKKLKYRRKLQELSYKLEYMAQRDNVDVEDALKEIDETKKNITEITDSKIIHLSKLLEDGIEKYSIEGNYSPTGFDSIDSRLIGLFKSELIILAARPGMGKTALAMNIALNVARRYNVLFVSLEMKPKQLALRAISSMAKIDSDLVRRGKTTAEDNTKFNVSKSQLKDFNLTIAEVYSLDQIVYNIRNFVQRNDLALVVIDYLQLIQVPTHKNFQRYLQVGEISRRLKLLACELDVAILCLAQLNRSAEDRVPRLSDLRESGDIEQDADVVMFIHKNSEEVGDVVQLLFAKNRSGKADSYAKMVFKKNHTRFYDPYQETDFDKCIPYSERLSCREN